MNHSEFRAIVSATPIADNADNLATACVLCSHNCGLRVDVEDGRISAVRGDDTSPISSGYVCNKGFSIDRYIDHAQRVHTPLRRTPDGDHEPISWDQAIREIGAKLRDIRARHGAQALALTGIGGQGNHLDGPYALAFLLGYGSAKLFNALAQEKTQHALVDDWLFRAPSGAMLHADAEHSSYVLMMGTNPVISNRGRNATELLRELSRDPERTLVVVDPRRTETARKADIHLPVRASTDAYLLLGMAAHIVRSGLHDRAFIADKVRGIQPLLAVLRSLEPAAMAERSGVDADALTRVAEDFARAPSACVFVDLGVEQTEHSTLISYLIRVLLVLTNNMGRTGGNVFFGTFGSDSLPLQKETPRALVSGIEGIAMLMPVGMFSPNLLPEEIQADHPERIRALVCEGANPMLQYADTNALQAAFSELELLVVIEPAMTETARLADYVLPTPVGYEKWEYSGFPKHYPDIHAHIRPPVVAGPPQALPEAEIYHRLATASGIVGRAPRILHTLARRAHRPTGMAAFLSALVALAAASGRSRERAFARAIFWSYETLGPRLPARSLAALWLITQGYALQDRAEILRGRPDLARHGRLALGLAVWEELMRHPEGRLVGRLDARRNLEDHLRTADGRIDLAQPEMVTEIRRVLALTPQRDTAYPLILNGGMRTRWNANTVQRDPGWRKGKGPHCELWMNPDDAQAAGLQKGESARLETRVGVVELPVRIDASVQVGNVMIPNGFGIQFPDQDTGELVTQGVGINVLTAADERDPFTGCPYHKSVRCRVTRVSRVQRLAGDRRA